MQPEDDGGVPARRRDAATCRTRPSKLLYEEVDGWQVMSANQASIDAFKARGRPRRPRARRRRGVLAGDGRLPGRVDLQGVRQRQDRDGRAAHDAPGRRRRSSSTRSATSTGSPPSLRTTSDGIRFDTTVRGTPGSLLRSVHERRRDAELRAVAAEAAAGRRARLHRLPRRRRARSPGSRTTRSLKSPELKQLRSVVGQIGTLVEGEDALYVRPSERRHPRDHARHHAARRAPTARRRSTRSSRTRASATRPSRRRSPAPTRGASSSATPASRSTTRTSATSSSSPTAPAGIEAVVNPRVTGSRRARSSDAIDASERARQRAELLLRRHPRRARPRRAARGRADPRRGEEAT